MLSKDSIRVWIYTYRLNFTLHLNSILFHFKMQTLINRVHLIDWTLWHVFLCACFKDLCSDHFRSLPKNILWCDHYDMCSCVPAFIKVDVQITFGVSHKTQDFWNQKKYHSFFSSSPFQRFMARMRSHLNRYH